MDFFKSILLDDPEPVVADNPQGSETNPLTNPSPKHQEVDGVDDSNPNPNSRIDGGARGGWSFGGLMKTLTTRSESVLETYRRDLKEFGSGLKKETDLFREVASRAVKDLPAEIDGVLKSTADIISHGKDTLLATSNLESDASETNNFSDKSSNSRRYSRFDSQKNAIQRDMRTYCEEPEDLEDYNQWKLGFVLQGKKDEVESLVGENGAMEEIYKRIVPNEVEQDTFWYRYFYRVHKLKQQEDMRANLVKRSLSIDYDEELTWDVDDEEEVEANKASEPNTLGNEDLPQIGRTDSSKDESKFGETESCNDESKIVKTESSNDESKIGTSGVADENGEKNTNVVSVDKGNVVEPSGENVMNEKVESVPKSDEKVDNGESCKDSDVSVVSNQPSFQEEDLGWDEIEDLGSNDDKKVSHGESPNKADVRKRLSAAEEDADLSWDIEDDDEPVKA